MIDSSTMRRTRFKGYREPANKLKGAPPETSQEHPCVGGSMKPRSKSQDRTPSTAICTAQSRLVEPIHKEAQNLPIPDMGSY